MNNERPTSYRVQDACENCKYAKEDERAALYRIICMHDAPEALKTQARLEHRSADDRWVALTYFRTVAEHGICDHYEHK